MVLCIGVAYLISNAYDYFFAPLWEKGITRMCQTDFVKKLEHTYTNMMEK